jgi:hypothetical protein
MNAKQINRAMNRQDRMYKVVADLYEGECQWSSAHLLMGKGASFRRMKKAAKALMKTNQFSLIHFRYSGQIINPKTTKQLVEGWDKTSPADRARNHWWPAMVAFYVKMNKCAERINAQYAS